MSQRKIIHIDMDAFYASVEQRDRPEYRGRPIAVGYDGPRGVVATASYEARPYGVHSALSSVLAKRLCPELIFVPARFDVYKAVSRQIRAIFGEYTELVEPLSLDEAFLDVSHVRSATLVAREIKARILAETGLTASAGISVNKMLAKIASDYRKPDGLFTIPPERIEEFVAGLPVERFFGIGEVTAEKMHRLGIRTGADLRLWNEAALVQQFGKAGHSYYGYARGIDEREVTPNRVRKSLGAETTFAEDTDDREQLRLELSAVREEVWNRGGTNRRPAAGTDAGNHRNASHPRRHSQRRWSDHTCNRGQDAHRTAAGTGRGDGQPVGRQHGKPGITRQHAGLPAAPHAADKKTPGRSQERPGAWHNRRGTIRPAGRGHPHRRSTDRGERCCSAVWSPSNGRSAKCRNSRRRADTAPSFPI